MSDQVAPETRGWPEDRNPIHWLENRASIPAVEISVDIVSQQ
jgi:hypothetical protein